jgi:transcriptional regulator with XRE-family HTH domain
MSSVTETVPTLVFEMASIRRVPDEGLGERIRRFRLAKGLSQTELGKLVGLSKRMVAYYEIQGGNPPSDLLIRLADALGVPLAMLAGRREKAPPRTPPVSLRLWKRLKRIEELPEHDRKTILKMIETMADARRRAS